MSRAAFLDLLLATGAALGALLVLLGVLACAGWPPGEVAATWLHGAVGNGQRLALTLEGACPLLLTGLAAACAFRCGVWNIGAEGQFLAGAALLVACGTRWALPGPAWVVLPVALLLAAAAGAAWALVASALERWRGVPVVLSTILLNLIAVQLIGALVEGPLHDPQTSAPQTALVDARFTLPVLADGTQLHLGVVLAFVLAIALWLVERRTTFGFELLVTGLNPRAARLAGMPVATRRWQVMGLSGALAGLAGGVQVAGVTGFLSGTPASYGYAGIAVALLGGLHPLGVAAAALFFAMLDGGARALERGLDVPHDLGDLASGAIVLVVVVGSVAVQRRRLARPAPDAATTLPGKVAGDG